MTFFIKPILELVNLSASILFAIINLSAIITIGMCIKEIPTPTRAIGPKIQNNIIIQAITLGIVDISSYEYSNISIVTKSLEIELII